MNRKRRIYQFIITLILFGNIWVVKAQNDYDHLKPVGSIFDVYNHSFEYYPKIRKVLFKGLSEIGSEIRFQVVPSFFSESILCIEFDRGKNKYYIVYHICEKPIWNNKNWRTIKVKKFKSEIDKKSVELIKSLFGIAISQVRFPQTDTYYKGLDGADYYFSIHDSWYGKKSGTVWSPDAKTKMIKLVDIGNKLIELAKSKKEIVKIDEKLEKEIKELIEELK